jgi:hypothetical protein
VRIVVPVLLGATCCDAESRPRGGASEAGESGKADDASELTGLDIVFIDGFAIDATAAWQPDASAAAQRLTWSISVTEGLREISRSVVATAIVAAGDGLAKQSISTDVFRGLGKPTDAMTEVRRMDLEVAIESCRDTSCSALAGPRSDLRRGLSFLVRPYPDAVVRGWGPDPGDPDTDALEGLSDAIEGAGCGNVLVAVNGTRYEGAGGGGPSWHLLRDGGYDCLVSVAYHDRDEGWGGLTSDDTLMFCSSAELGLEALDQVWRAAVVEPEVAHWAVFGHSKGAAAAVKFYQRRHAETRNWPDARVYATGLPWRMGAQYLPTPDAYAPGWIYAHDQLVAFTWGNDNIQFIDVCADFDIAYIDEAHDYTPMFDSHVDGDPERAAARDAFVEGRRHFVGDRYE